jgi:drug/metabolite transporter (DMT)-like permease
VLISSLDFASEKSTLFGNFMAICGAIGAAGYILAGRRLRAEMSTLHYVTAVYSVCAVMLLVAVIVIGDPLFGHGVRNYLYLFGIALIPQTIGHTTLNWSLKYFSATTISVLLLGEPIVATLLAWILLGERIGGMNVAGGLVIIAGLAIVLRGEMKRRGK